MKAILMSIQSPHVCNILNFIKLWEIRKKFPSDYVGWVYIYCTQNEYLICDLYTGKARYNNIPKGKNGFTLSGKVVARFWCDKVEEIYNNRLGMIMFPNKRYVERPTVETKTLSMDDLLKQSCLTEREIFDYLQVQDGCAIHITKLEIFDKPKELSEFKHLVKYTCKTCPYNHEDMDGDICSKCCETKPLTRAPQSWCHIEI